MSKVVSALDYLNDNTDGGFFKLRQVKNDALTKKASYYKYVNGQKVETGFMSLVEGIVADDSRKIRGDRANIVLYEEAGSNPKLESSVIKGEELVNPGGNKIGISIIGGTGGDKDGAEGLRHIYDNPLTFKVLPFRHNYTADQSVVITSYFIPAYKTLDKDEFIDSRGWCNEEKAREHFENIRNEMSKTPSALIMYCAEQCFTAEEALSLEGNNKFNRALIAEQIAYLRLYKDTSVPIQNGELRFLYKQKDQGINSQNINGVEWIPSNKGSIHIIEPPLWTTNKKAEMANLYVAGIDSIDIGQAQTSDYTTDPSKFCIIIYKRAYGTQSPAPVAYYMDRPHQVEEAFQKALKLMIWYNCKCNIEATRLSMWNYAKNRGFSNYFMARPRATYMDLSKRRSSTIGTPATPTIIDHQTDLIASYIEEFSNCIWFPELLDQLNRYSDENKGKFDMIASFGMALLADEELSGTAPKEVDNYVEEWQDIGWYRDSDGIKRYGLIPNQQQITNAKISWDSHFKGNDYGLHSSDPRYMNTYDRR